MLQGVFERALVLFALLLTNVLAINAFAEKTTHLILVDKKRNELHLAEYAAKGYKIIKSFHTTVGQVKGDKFDEGDLKTPEGVYTLTGKVLPPTLKAKFGIMAFTLNFPNTWDELAGRTGSHIMVHATNEPDRLSKDFDSEGCVVVKNEEIQELSNWIRVGLTPILIFEDIQANGGVYFNPTANVKLAEFFQSWVRSWENRDIETYISHYHSHFSAQGKNRTEWKAYKQGLNSRYTSIEVGPEDIRYYPHPKYTVVQFTQNYRSKVKGGGWGFKSRGTKILYVSEEDGQPKVVAESYSPLNW